MNVIVKKFGGTSLGAVDRIERVAKLLIEAKQQEDAQIVVVVSAMAGETDRLINLGRSVSNSQDRRELDALLVTGELQSAALLALKLNALGCKAASLNAFQAGIGTSAEHGKASIEKIDCHRMIELLSEGVMAVVAGFQGISAAGDFTTIGRGGSDISAVALAAALKAKQCQIYTDVAGVYSAEPRIVPRAKVLDKICFEEMLELASLGAKVLHPRSARIAMAFQVPLIVRSTFSTATQTEIVKRGKEMEHPVISSIANSSDQALLTLENTASQNCLSVIFNALSQQRILVDMVAKSFAGTENGADKFSGSNLSFTVSDSDSAQALETCRGQLERIGARSVSVSRDIAKVSAVGIGLLYQSSVPARFYKALESAEVPVLMACSSEIRISVLVPKKYMEAAVRALHAEFIEQSA